MPKRDAKLSVYVTSERKRDLERRADDADLGVSTYVNQLIDRQMQMEAENEVSAQVRATEQLQRTIDEGERQLRDVAGDIRDMNAKMGAYAIAAFELQKQDHGQSEVRDALSTGSRRLREDHDPQEAVPNDDAETVAEARESDTDGDDSSDPFAHRRE